MRYDNGALICSLRGFISAHRHGKCPPHPEPDLSNNSVTVDNQLQGEFYRSNPINKHAISKSEMLLFCLNRNNKQKGKAKMKVDSGISSDLSKVPKQAKALEELGMSGIMTAETAHDPFFPLLVAAQNTEHVELITSIAVAFARTPMILANIGHDLNQYSKGRFVLGLGSQIKPHITKRFSMPWSNPAARMREYILAMRAIWANWHQQEPLAFTGKFYTHTLMTPMFTPTDTQYGAPRVLLAAVGPMMTEVAGEVADGIIVHAFTTEKYMREVTMPALERGFAKSGRKREDFEISYPSFLVTGTTEEAMSEAAMATRKQIAFYGSTPAYKPVLESIGAGDLQGDLNTMSKQGRWDEMGELITDDILNAFAVVSEPDGVADEILRRYGDMVDRTSAAYGGIPADQQRSIIDKLSGHQSKNNPSTSR